MTKINKKIIGVIPARYASKRFPGKLLADIHGKPMIWWVYKNAKKSKLISELMVATDDERIEEVCEYLNIPHILTSPNHPTGTDRVNEVARKIKGDLYVNIQGDEPMINYQNIDAAIEPMLHNNKIQISSLMIKIEHISEALNNNVVKVAVNHNNEAIFLSRLPIPFEKESFGSKYYRHIGLYCFRPKALKMFSSTKQGVLEKSEGIELLRYLENHISIQMVEVKEGVIGVDTPTDLEIIRNLIKPSKKT